MNIIKKGYDYLKGDEKEKDGRKLPKAKFQSTKWAECIVSGTKDDILVFNEKAMSAIRNHYHDVVSLVGPPGVGKSTLASTMYNILRGNRDEYFKGSNSMEGFTKGVWSLREKAKVKYNDKDKINVLDLEGLEDKDIIHYFVVVVMSLSKAILLCANYNGSPRFKWDVFKTLQSAVRVYRENGIRVPDPIIYVQVPFNEKKGRAKSKFHLNGGKVDHAGLVQYIKSHYPELKDFDIRLYALPIFDNGNDGADSDSEDDGEEQGNQNIYNNDARFDEKYTTTVTALINELTDIDEGVVIEERVNYARGVAAALNNNSPSIIADMNLKFLKTEIKKYRGAIEASAIETVRADARKVRMKDTVIDEAEFCKLVCRPDGKYRYGKTLQAQVSALSYYDPEQLQHRKIMHQLDDEKRYYIEVGEHCKDIYKSERSKTECRIQEKAEKRMKIDQRSFESILDTEIDKAAKRIQRDGDTSMPPSLELISKEHATRFKSDIINSTQIMVTFPSQYFNMSTLRDKWSTKTVDLRRKWQILKEEEEAAAAEQRRIRKEQEEKERERINKAGDELYEKHQRELESFIDVEMTTAGNQIPFNSSLKLPYSVKNRIKQKENKLRKIMKNKTEGKYNIKYEIPSTYLRMAKIDRLEEKWQIEVNDLKKGWEKQKRRALVERRKVVVTGDTKCPSCGQEHLNSLTHKSCTKSEGGKGTIYYWVDGPTSTSICDQCGELRITKGNTVCYTCSAPMNTEIKPIN